MTSEQRREYLAKLSRQTAGWIRRSRANPGVAMRPYHVLLHAVALRRMTGRAA